MYKNETKIKKIITGIRNNPVIVLLIFIGTIIIALASFTNAAKNLFDMITGQSPEEARQELRKLSLNFEPNVFLECAKKNDLLAVKLFLNAGMDPNVAKKRFATTALMYAAGNNNMEMIEALMDKKADLNQTNNGGYTALAWAATEGNMSIVEYLIDEGADINAINKAFTSSVEYGQIEMMRYLFQHGAKPKEAGVKGLEELIWSDRLKLEQLNAIVITLLDMDVDINVKLSEGWTILLLFTKKTKRNDSISFLKTLLNRNADVNAQCECPSYYGYEGGMTALMLAVEAGNIKAVRLLLDNGAKINTKNTGGQTALMIAAKNSETELTKILLGNNAEVNINDHNGWTALMYAATNDNPDMFQFLIDQGAEINIKNKKGRTALMISAKKPQPKIVKILLEKGAHVNIRDNDGRTALMFAAVQYENVESVRDLLSHNASKTIKDNFGKTALDYAIEELDPDSRINSQIVAMLK